MDVCLAAVQMKGRSGQVDWNLSRAERLIRSSSAGFIEGRTIVCLPELFATGYDLTPRAFRRVAEGLSGRTVETLSGWAQRFGAYLYGGIAEEGEQGVVYDSSVLVSPKGKLLGSYRKIHLAGSHERSAFKAGDRTKVIRTRLCRMGLSICYDQVFPEVTRRLAFQGAEVILHSSAWSSYPREMDWGPKEYGVFSVARAMENTVFFASSNRTGIEGRFKFVGQTRIIAPWGGLLASKNLEEGCAVAQVDLGALEQSRSTHPCLEEERRTAYATSASRRGACSHESSSRSAAERSGTRQLEKPSLEGTGDFNAAKHLRVAREPSAGSLTHPE